MWCVRVRTRARRTFGTQDPVMTYEARKILYVFWSDAFCRGDREMARLIWTTHDDQRPDGAALDHTPADVRHTHKKEWEP